MLAQPADQHVSFPVGYVNFSGPGGAYGGGQSAPISMVGEYKPQVDRVPVKRATNLQPAGRQRRGHRAEAGKPGGVDSRQRGNNQPAAPGLANGIRRRVQGSWQIYARTFVDGAVFADHLVGENWTHLRIQTGEDSLRLAHCRGEENAGQACRLIVLPPFVELRENRARRTPLKHGQSKRGFGQEDIATDRFKGLASRIRG